MTTRGLIEIEGGQSIRRSHFIPLTTQTFFSGLVTQRSPFNSMDNRYYSKYLGGRPDQLIDGLNMELTNYGTYIRRPGFLPYSTASIPSPIGFYSFKQFTASSTTITLLADTATNVQVFTPTTQTTLFTKAAGAGKTYFQSVGNTLYMGDGVDLLAWDNNNPIRNWGISIGSVSSSVSQYCGTGSQSGSSSVWANPTRIQGAPDSSFTTNTVVAPAGTAVFGNSLKAVNYGFSIPPVNSVQGIQVTLTGLQSAQFGGFFPKAFVNIYLSYNGNRLGTFKSAVLPLVSGNVVLGSSSDSWGATLTPNIVNSANFGLEISPVVDSTGLGSHTVTFSLDAAQITVFDVGAPIVSVDAGAANTVDTINGGWTYIFAYGNSNSGHVSNPTPPSNSTGNFGGTGVVNTSGTAVTWVSGSQFTTGTSWNGRTITINGASFTVSSVTDATHLVLTATAGTQSSVAYFLGFPGVDVPLTASNDPQVNQIRVFRTRDGNVGNYFELPTSPYPNTTQTILDSATDSQLQQFIFFQTSPTTTNTPPPAGLVRMTYHLQRVWGAVGNVVYYSGGPDTLLGNGNESFPPGNNFTFPDQVIRMVPISSGLLVFTTNDIWIIIGTNTATFYPKIYFPGLGLVNYDALDVEGTNIFLYTHDKQFVNLTPSGPAEFGYAIGNTLESTFDPAISGVSSIVWGTSEKAVYINDGSANWYRCNWNQPPEGGPAWSPRAAITGGLSHVQNVELPGNTHQLMVGTPGGTILVRDLNTFSDNGAAYPAFLTIGSLVLAQPGQIAEIESVTLELQARGTLPTLGILLDEISGAFEALTLNVPDPPMLAPSVSLFSNRWYLSQGAAPSLARHLQVKIIFSTEIAKNELLTQSIWGAINARE